MSGINELGDFLRARRDCMEVAQTALPGLEGRRVPGLRREEVALLAGVSTDYYARLEQGRERHPSEQVLDAIARALQFDGPAADHLFRLARPGPRVAEAEPLKTVSDELLTLMDHYVHVPATVTSPALDVLAANDLARTLYGGFSSFDNLMRMVFLDPAAQTFYVDWERAARGVVANFRASSRGYSGDPRVAAVVGEITLASPAFTDIWARHEVDHRFVGPKRLRHAQVGDMRLDYQAFSVTGAPGQQLLVYSAAPGTPSADALHLLRHASHFNNTEGEQG